MIPLVEQLMGLALSESFQSAVLAASVTGVIVLAGLVFILQEGMAFMRSIGGSPVEPVSQGRTREYSRTPRGTDSRRAVGPSADTPRETERPLREVEQSGVSIVSRVRQDRDGHVLTVQVTNKSEQRIEMVVVDIDTPTGIDSRSGSFRMQRLGTIRPGEIETAEFSLLITSGTPQDITGYVEFMSASYEVSRIEIPTPEITRS